MKNPNIIIFHPEVLKVRAFKFFSLTLKDIKQNNSLESKMLVVTSLWKKYKIQAKVSVGAAMSPIPLQIPRQARIPKTQQVPVQLKATGSRKASTIQ